MEADPFTKLAPRMRECLRLVADLKDSEQIGFELGIRPGTVDGYLKEAVRLLGATSRRHAAMMLREHERRFAELAPAPSPGKLGGQLSGVPETYPYPPARYERAGGDRASAVREEGLPFGWPAEALGAGSIRLPFRAAGGRRNDLSGSRRMLWIAALPLILATAFGMLAIGLQVIATLIAAAFRAFG
jgi:DNA-binding CsgD family transcriptional regulator